MLFFLYGPDTFRSRLKLDELILHFQKIHQKSLSLVIFNGDNLDFDDLVNEIRSVSMFKEKKFLVVKNFFGNKKFKEDFLKNHEKITGSENIILFYESGEVDKREAFFKMLFKKTKTQEFSALDGPKLAAWLKEYLLSSGVKIEPLAFKKLIFYVGSDLWQMQNEIIKLKNYAKNRPINLDDVALLVRPKIENDIFETIDVLAQKRKNEAIYLIHKHLEKGDSALYLLSMINFQFRNLLVVKDLIQKKVQPNDLAKKSGLHPFVAQKTYWLAEKFNLAQLKKIYHQIFQIDLAVKTGKIDPETALDIFAAGL
jgi:DNA polymerase III subunit delta